jgi:hypothetical protein
MAMAIEGNGGDAAMSHGLINVPGIEGSIGSEVGGKETQRGYGAQVERGKIGDIASEFGERMSEIDSLLWRNYWGSLAIISPYYSCYNEG